MPATINPLRKALVKQEYLRTGGNGYKALKAGGLAENTARHCVDKKNTLLNLVKEEIKQDIKQRITVETVLAGLESIQALATAEKDFSTSARCEELKGKWLAMFTDKSEVRAEITQKPEEKEELMRLRGHLLHIN